VCNCTKKKASNSVIAVEFVVALGERCPCAASCLGLFCHGPFNLEALNKNDAAAGTSAA